MIAPSANHTSAERIRSLDGWRAIAITVVVVSHIPFASGFPGERFPGWREFLVFQGNFGVRIFFVLSGFLITSMLLADADRHGRPSLRRFYVRRVLRIFPVYYLFVAVVAALAAGHLYQDRWTSWLGAMTFTRNVIGYGRSATVHLWSLAIEEQFYLIWPVTIVALSLWRRTTLAVGLLIALVVLSQVVRTGVIQPHLDHWLAVRLLSGNSIALYADSLAVGCLGAFLIRRYRPAGDAVPRWSLAVAVAGVIFVELWQEYGSGTPVAWWAVMPLIQAVLIMAAIWMTIERRDGIAHRMLNAAPMVWLGTLSYSLYMWQQLFLGHFTGSPLADLAIYDWRVWWIFAVGAAAGSYYAVERPILALRDRLAPRDHGIKAPVRQ